MENKDLPIKERYEGMFFTTNEGYLVKIVEYKNKNNVIIFYKEFNYYKTARIKDVKSGTIRCPFHKSVYGIGYLGEGLYDWNCNKIRIVYKIWHSMMTRCYDQKYIDKHPTYKGCSVCEEWHNFQNFAKWYEENYYDINGEKMCLDKDILFKGNKVYSPETCVFAPKTINNLFIKSDAIRGEFPIGVNFHKSSGKFQANCEGKYLGVYENQYQAFRRYKEFKEGYIKQMAVGYKDIIPHKLYEAMKEYEVDIND